MKRPLLRAFFSRSSFLVWSAKQQLQISVTDLASYPFGARCWRDTFMKRDGYDPDKQSAYLYAERWYFAKVLTSWLTKASVSSIIAQRKPAVLRILFPTLIVFMSNLTSVEVKNFETVLNGIHPLVRHLWPRNNFVSLSDRLFSCLFCFKRAISERKLLF